MALRSRKWLFGCALLGMLAFPFLVGGSAAIDGLTLLRVRDYLGILAVVVVSWCAHAFKLRSLLGHLGTDVSAAMTLRASLAADVGFLVTPGGVGGYATSVYYLRRIGASLNGAVAITSADQAFDAIFFTIAIPLAACATASQIPMPSLSWVIALMGAVAILAIAALAWRTFFAHGERPLFSGAFARSLQRLREFVLRVIEDLRKLLAQERALFLRALLLTSVQQLCRYGALWLIFLGLGHPLPFARVLLGQSLVVQAAALTGIPAGGGVAELGLTAAFGDSLPAAAMATALLLWRAATLYLGLVFGLGAMASFSISAPTTSTPGADQGASVPPVAKS